MIPAAPSLPNSVRAEVDASIAHSALALERVLSVGRIVFYVAVLVRFGWIGPVNPWHALANSPLVIGIVFSVVLLVAVKAPPRGHRFWALSVTLDAFAAHAALSGNALWPYPGYAGILTLPETTGVLLAVVSAGLRLSLPVALWGGSINLVGLLTLVAIDRAVSGIPWQPETLSVHLIFVGAATILAAVFAFGTRRIVARATAAALRAQHAERGLGTVLVDCHDARSLLTSARLGVEFIERRLQSHSDAPLRDASGVLAQDLVAVEQLILGVTSRALADLWVAGPATPVRVAQAMAPVLGSLRQRFGSVTWVAEGIPSALRVSVTGGEAAFLRVLWNMLTNAAEGDGTRGATTVRIEVVVPNELEVEICVTDDGPGWTAPAGISTKLTGLGVGMRVVRGVVEASGGLLSVRARAEGGTVVCVRLPRAPALE